MERLGRLAGWMRAAARGGVGLLLLGLALASTAQASVGQMVTLEASTNVIRLPWPGSRAVAELDRAGFDIAAARPGAWVDVLGPPGAARNLRARGHDARLLPGPPARVPDHFRSYDEVLAQLEAFAAQYPQITHLEAIGPAWGTIYALPGYPRHNLWALKISDAAAVDEMEPVVVYVGGQHAREPAGVEITLGIAAALLAGYGTDPQVTGWVDAHETWIVPLVNPDGHWCCRELEWPGWRKNVRDNDQSGDITDPWGDEQQWYWPDGVDLNRNHGWQWGGAGTSHDPLEEVYCGPEAFSEPESGALRDFLARELPALLVDYHSYGELVLWPFGYDDSTQAPDNELLGEIGAAVAECIPSWAGPGPSYRPEQANQLYPASGTLCDWAYGELNAFALTIETCTVLYPDEDELMHAVSGNVIGALRLQERLDGPGVRGRLTALGQPVQGTILVLGLDEPQLSTPRRSHAELGDYYRLLAPGTYDLRFEAPGWEPLEVAGVVVSSGGATVLDVDLTVPAGVAGPLAAARPLRIRPNPAPVGGQVRFEWRGGESGALQRIEILDCSGRVVARVGDLYGDGAGFVWSPDARTRARLSAGLYLVRSVVAGGPAVTGRFVLVGAHP